MVRLVFRPYTQVRKAICTSAHLRASTRVSSGFALLRHSSPSFGSQQTCSHSNLSQKIMVGRWCRHRPSHQSGYLRFMGLPPTSSHACYTPWSVFQDGQIGSLPPASSGRSSRGTLRAPFHPRSPGRHRRRIERRVSPARLTDADQPPAHTADRQAGISLGAPAASNPFPLNNFKHFFNSLFKVLFIFPSRYLFAIGLPPVFSLRWDLPPALGCIPKQPDSAKAPRGVAAAPPTGLSPSRTPPSRGLGRCSPQRTLL